MFCEDRSDFRVVQCIVHGKDVSPRYSKNVIRAESYEIFYDKSADRNFHQKGPAPPQKRYEKNVITMNNVL